MRGSKRGKPVANGEEHAVTHARMIHSITLLCHREERRNMRLPMDEFGDEPDVVSDSESDSEGQTGLAMADLLGATQEPHLRLKVLAGTRLPPPVYMGENSLRLDKAGVLSMYF